MSQEKNLEKKILDKVYQFEAKRTTVEILLKITVFIFLSGLIFIFAKFFFNILKTQKTLDLLEIFKEDTEVLKRYFFDNLFLLFFELPKALLFILFIFLSLLVFLLLTVIKNFKKIKNRIKSLLKQKEKKT